MSFDASHTVEWESVYNPRNQQQQKPPSIQRHVVSGFHFHCSNISWSKIKT